MAVLHSNAHIIEIQSYVETYIDPSGELARDVACGDITRVNVNERADWIYAQLEDVFAPDGGTGMTVDQFGDYLSQLIEDHEATSTAVEFRVSWQEGVTTNADGDNSYDGTLLGTATVRAEYSDDGVASFTFAISGGVETFDAQLDVALAAHGWRRVTDVNAFPMSPGAGEHNAYGLFSAEAVTA